MSPKQADTRRQAAVRTAWIVAGIAFAFYAGFILMGVIGK